MRNEEFMDQIRDTDWFNLLCLSARTPGIKFNKQILPSFPSESLQENTTGASGPHTIKNAFLFYEDCVKIFNELGRPIGPGSRLLDFGTGWGRIARCFLRDIPRNNLFGVDVDPEFIAVCQESFGPDGFSVCNPYPPTELPDMFFDYIVGYSVFSHLSENACKQWMKEFHRLLKPGGFAVMTTRDRSFLDYCMELNKKSAEGYQKSLSEIFPDFEEVKARYDRGEFVHSNNPGLGGGGPRNSDFYGESFIPEAYAKHAYLPEFKIARFHSSPGRHQQPMMFFVSQ